jgi:molybdenum cofactor biosynthesis protein B
MSKAQDGLPQVVGVAVLTVSDTRTEATDTSGLYLRDAALAAGHQVVAKRIVKDDIYDIRAVVSAWIADVAVQAIVITGGTGFSSRDSTPEAVSVLFDKTIEGFGEVFRWLSLEEIGTSTVQSRALGGLANNTVIFCLPGSTNACRTGWEKIIRSQLDSTYRPCNFVGVLNTRRTTGQ